MPTVSAVSVSTAADSSTALPRLTVEWGAIATAAPAVAGNAKTTSGSEVAGRENSGAPAVATYPAAPTERMLMARVSGRNADRRFDRDSITGSSPPLKFSLRWYHHTGHRGFPSFPRGPAGAVYRTDFDFHRWRSSANARGSSSRPAYRALSNALVISCATSSR